MLGIILGILIAVMFTWPLAELGLETRSEISNCEQQLPRDQYCKIIAVPMESNYE